MKKILILGTTIVMTLAVFMIARPVFAQIKDVLATSSVKIKPHKINRMDPFGNMRMYHDQFFKSMQQEMDEINSLFRSRMPSNSLGMSPMGFSNNLSTGNADMKLEGDNLVIKVDLPGHSKDAIDLRIKDNSLIISSERKSQNTEEKDKYFRKEISYGSFSRTIELPRKVFSDKVVADYKDGVLTVHAPIDNSKPIEPKGIKIPVN